MTATTAAAAPDPGGDRRRDDDGELLRAGPRPDPGPGQATALFRYELISPLLDEGLSRAERGAITDRLCAAEHPGPDGAPVTVSPATLRRWIASYRGGGFAALVPAARNQPFRHPVPVRAAALALKDANPARTARMIRITLLGTYPGREQDVPSERTLQRWFAGLSPSAPGPGSQAPGAFGRFEAQAPMDRWTGDILHGPALGGRPAYLHAFLDDHSRQVMAARFTWHPDVIDLAGVLRWALAEHGAPSELYVDNGACYTDAWLRRACAVLGIRLVHSRPYRPQGRGKIERFFGTVRSQFLPELTPAALEGTDLAGLNALLGAWIGEDYSRAVHSGTGQAPAARFTQNLPPGRGYAVHPARLREAFFWSAARTADRATAVVKFHGGKYSVDKALAGRRVELLFSPFDLTVLHVRHGGADYGTAVPLVIGRHAHPKAAKHDPPEPDPGPPGDPATPYLDLLSARRREREVAGLNYQSIFSPEDDDEKEEGQP